MPRGLLSRFTRRALQQLRAARATSAAQRRRAARGGCAPRGPLLGGFWTSLRRVARIPGSQLAVFALSPAVRSETKRKKQQQILTARTPCRPAARRRRDLRPQARRAARLDRVCGKCTAAAPRTKGEAPHLLRQRPAARRRRRRGGLMTKHKPSPPHTLLEMRPGKRARARSRT